MPALVWRSPWRVGDAFRIVRKIQHHITAEALGLKDERFSLDGEERWVYHARAVAEEKDGLAVELSVEPPVPKEWDHRYKLTMDARGMMAHWDGGLDAMHAIGGLGGGERYGVITGLLREFPAGPIDLGRTWTFTNTVVLAHCNSAAFELSCTLGAGRSEAGEAEYLVNVDLNVQPAAQALVPRDRRRIGAGVWRISADLRTIRGRAGFEFRNEAGKSILTWSEEVEVAPERKY